MRKIDAPLPRNRKPLVHEERVQLPFDSALARGFFLLIKGEPALAGAQARTLVRT